MALELRLVVPGDPVAQGRPRFTRFSRGRPLATPRAIDPERSRAWKALAGDVFFATVARAGLPRPAFIGPVQLVILAVFECPRAQHRKRSPAERRPRASAPDAENVAKAVMDAGTGILWRDDGQVASLTVDKVYGAQGEQPCVEVLVRELSA